MSNIGSNIKKISIKQPLQTTISVPQTLRKYKLSELDDVVTTGVQDDYVLAYNADIEKYILEPLEDLVIANIRGGFF